MQKKADDINYVPISLVVKLQKRGSQGNKVKSGMQIPGAASRTN